MTEKEFDRKMEEMTTRFERQIEKSADKLDQSVIRKYNESKLFRFLTKGLSIIAEIGLLIGAKRLAEKDYKTAAIWCAGLGMLGLLTEVLRILIFRRTR